MKKVILYAAVAFAAVAGTVCYNSESENEMSDLAKANVKALGGTNAVEIPCAENGFGCIFLVKDSEGHFRFLTIENARHE